MFQIVDWWVGRPLYGHFSQFPLAIALLVPLSLRRPPSVGGLLRYAPTVPLLLVLATEAGAQFLPRFSGLVREGLLFGLFLAGLLWLAVDERVTMALGLMFLESFLVQVVFLADGVQSLPTAAIAMAITAAFPATLLLAGVGAARHQSRL